MILLKLDISRQLHEEWSCLYKSTYSKKIVTLVLQSSSVFCKTYIFLPKQGRNLGFVNGIYSKF